MVLKTKRTPDSHKSNSPIIYCGRGKNLVVVIVVIALVAAVVPIGLLSPTGKEKVSKAGKPKFQVWFLHSKNAPKQQYLCKPLPGTMMVRGNGGSGQRRAGPSGCGVQRVGLWRLPHLAQLTPAADRSAAAARHAHARSRLQALLHQQVPPPWQTVQAKEERGREGGRDGDRETEETNKKLNPHSV